MAIVLLASSITFPFQITIVVATDEAESESNTAPIIVDAAVQITNNSTQTLTISNILSFKAY